MASQVTLLPALAAEVSTGEFFALILSSAVASTAISHYLYVQQNAVMLGASGYVMAILGFLLASRRTAGAKIALRDTLIAELGRFIATSTQRKSSSWISPSTSINYAAHIVRHFGSAYFSSYCAVLLNFLADSPYFPCSDWSIIWCGVFFSPKES